MGRSLLVKIFCSPWRSECVRTGLPPGHRLTDRVNRDEANGRLQEGGRPNTVARCAAPKGRAADGPSPPSERTDRARTTGAALEAHYRFLLWLVPALERFPRSRKFLLGDRIQRHGAGRAGVADRGDLYPAAGQSPGARQSGHREAALSAPAVAGPALPGPAPLRAHGALPGRDRAQDRRLRTLALADRIVDGCNPQEPVHLYFPGKEPVCTGGRRVRVSEPDEAGERWKRLAGLGRKFSARLVEWGVEGARAAA